MVANNSGAEARRLAAEYPTKVGHLYSPGAQRGPFMEFPYALDNGAFSSYKNGTPFDWDLWMNLLKWAMDAKESPRWALVPDVVGDALATRRLFDRAAPLVPAGLPLAYAAQDGFQFNDYPAEATVLFVGGTMAWKIANIYRLARAFPRVHVGRISRPSLLYRCAESGVESVDGTGWFRGNPRQLGALREFLAEQRRGFPGQLFAT